MPFRKGVSGNSEGRPSGTANKTTKELREILQKIIENNIKTVEKDLRLIEPEKRVKLLLQMAEFILPKLQRTEVRTDEEKKDEPIRYFILSDGTKIELL
jgi:hypothetical protein